MDVSIQAKLSLLREKLVKHPVDMSQEEKRCYLETLRDVVQEARREEPALDNIPDCDRERAVLRAHAQLRRDTKGDLVLPSAHELQAGLIRNSNALSSSVDFAGLTVVEIFLERNFNRLESAPEHPNHLFQEEEMYVRFGSDEQASCLLNLGCGLALDIYMDSQYRCQTFFRFSLPSKSMVLRAQYRKIGEDILNLKEIDQNIRAIGAVARTPGIPVLPDHFIQDDEFDKTVTALMEDVQFTDDQMVSKGGGKDALHEYLVSKCRVNRRGRQAALDVLIDQRINVLLKLCRYNQDETPFAFTRKFS